MPKRKQATPAASMMTHTILLQPKAETSDEALASLLKDVHSLQKSIPCLLSRATGENQSTRHKGFTHGIVLHFTDEVHMRDALTQPAYQKLQAKILHLCDQTIIFELPESIPLPASETEARLEDQHPGPEPTKRQKQGVPTQTLQTPPTITNRATISRAVQNHPVRQIDPRLKEIVVDQLGVEEGTRSRAQCLAC